MDGIVAKFGGSSTADAGMLRRVGAILGGDARYRCAVVSAPGGAGEGGRVTDLLEDVWRLRQAGQDADPPLDAIVRRYRAIARGLGLPDPGAEARREILAAAEISRARTLSRGESLLARLLAEWLGWPFVDAAEAVRFDESGALDERATAARLARINREEPFILPGFYGADGEGGIHTFPRNGSDITGALAAAALGASLYENWTDVDGLMTADPDVVPVARAVPRIGYRQMRMLSAAGARVLHPDCLAPVWAAGIPTQLRNTLRPEAPGTRIDGAYDRIVPCVAGRRVAGPMAIVSVFGAPAGAKSALVRALRGALVSEDAAAHRFLVDADHMESDMRAAHDVLYPDSLE